VGGRAAADWRFEQPILLGGWILVKLQIRISTHEGSITGVDEGAAFVHPGNTAPRQRAKPIEIKTALA